MRSVLVLKCILMTTLLYSVIFCVAIIELIQQIEVPMIVFTRKKTKKHFLCDAILCMINNGDHRWLSTCFPL